MKRPGAQAELQQTKEGGHVYGLYQWQADLPRGSSI